MRKNAFAARSRALNTVGRTYRTP